MLIISAVTIRIKVDTGVDSSSLVNAVTEVTLFLCGENEWLNVLCTSGKMSIHSLDCIWYSETTDRNSRSSFFLKLSTPLLKYGEYGRIK